MMASVALRIEDYGMIGDTETVALVGRDGSIDWCCLPHFNSPACFAKLLGTEEHGYWRIAPKASPAPGRGDPLLSTRRSYAGDSLVLVTDWDLPGGTLRVTDCMPLRGDHPQIVREVECLKGEVEVRMDLAIRFEYGSAIPWVRHSEGVFIAVAGPDALALWSPVRSHGQGMATVADFVVREGQRVPFVLSYFRSTEDVPRPIDATYAIHNTTQYWQDWSEMDHLSLGEWQKPVVRSLITLKALTFAPTGGIIAAPTTSLPESVGGNRNWDYRYSWLRDATLTLSALMAAGYHEEAAAWRDWLLRAVAGEPSKLQIMYGPAGERNLLEYELGHLPGYESSVPVRVGNAAAGQFQLDVYGEVLGALHEARRLGIPSSQPAWDLETAIMDFLESGWKEPDDGIWEVRGPRRHFTHSKVMAWFGVHSAIRDVEEFAMDGPIDKWKALRRQIHSEVCDKGFDSERNTFTQYYGSKELDASVLMIPLVGFLPGSDKRVAGTVDAIKREITTDGFVMRYDSTNSTAVDGLSGREGAFLACSFWMADCLHLIGRHDEAVEMFGRLVGLSNDLGLLAEEYDPILKRQVGNFPQAFTHVSLVNTAVGLAHSGRDTGMTHEDRVNGVKPKGLRRVARSSNPHRKHRLGLGR
ncbi:MAG: glycoside hydrolase family 15 protein [Acidimicrobiales bacterium]